MVTYLFINPMHFDCIEIGYNVSAGRQQLFYLFNPMHFNCIEIGYKVSAGRHQLLIYRVL